MYNSYINQEIITHIIQITKFEENKQKLRKNEIKRFEITINSLNYRVLTRNK